MADDSILNRQVFCGSIPGDFPEKQFVSELAAYCIRPLGVRLRANTGKGTDLLQVVPV